MDAQEQEGGRGEERGETGSRNGGRAGFAIDKQNLDHQRGSRRAQACDWQFRARERKKRSR